MRRLLISLGDICLFSEKGSSLLLTNLNISEICDMAHLRDKLPPFGSSLLNNLSKQVIKNHQKSRYFNFKFQKLGCGLFFSQSFSQLFFCGIFRNWGRANDGKLILINYIG